MARNIPPVDTHELAKQAFEKVVVLTAQVGTNKVHAQEARVEAKTELLGRCDELQKEIKGLGVMLKHILMSTHHPKWKVRRRFKKILKKWVLEAIALADKAEAEKKNAAEEN